MPENVELKPCPFCGGEAEYIKRINNGVVSSLVVCTDCGASSTEWYANDTYSSKDMAIQSWNRRAEDGK